MTTEQTSSAQAGTEVSAVVVVDTNIWRSTLMFKSAVGSALLHTLYRLRARIGLPEVVEQEIRRKLFKAAEEARAGVEKSARELGTLMGNYRAPVLPSPDEMRTAVEARIAELDEIIVRVPLTIEQTRKALARVYEGTPPNGPKNQQFKDSAIWESVLDLAPTHKVHLVTADGGFYDDKRQGLAPSLNAECVSQGARVQLHPSVEDCLRVLEVDAPKLDQDQLLRVANLAARPDILTDVEKREMRLLEMQRGDVKAFHTQEYDKLALSFRLVFSAEDLNDPTEKFDIGVRAEGSCQYSLREESASSVDLDLVEYGWRDNLGELHRSRSIFARLGGLPARVLSGPAG